MGGSSRLIGLGAFDLSALSQQHLDTTVAVPYEKDGASEFCLYLPMKMLMEAKLALNIQITLPDAVPYKAVLSQLSSSPASSHPCITLISIPEGECPNA